MPRIQDNKLELDYPCEWEYTIIGYDPGQLRQIAMQIADSSYSPKVIPGSSSGRGKYHSCHLIVQVKNESERQELFSKLKNNPAVRLVL